MAVTLLGSDCDARIYVYMFVHMLANVCGYVSRISNSDVRHVCLVRRGVGRLVLERAFPGAPIARRTPTVRRTRPLFAHTPFLADQSLHAHICAVIAPTSHSLILPSYNLTHQLTHPFVYGTSAGHPPTKPCLRMMKMYSAMLHELMHTQVHSSVVPSHVWMYSYAVIMHSFHR